MTNRLKHIFVRPSCWITDCERPHIDPIRFTANFETQDYCDLLRMTDITSIDAIDKLYAKDDTDHSILTDVTRNLGLDLETKKTDRRKKKLREELVREHILAQDKRISSARSLLCRWFGLG